MMPVWTAIADHMDSVAWLRRDQSSTAGRSPPESGGGLAQVLPLVPAARGGKVPARPWSRRREQVRTLVIVLVSEGLEEWLEANHAAGQECADVRLLKCGVQVNHRHSLRDLPQSRRPRATYSQYADSNNPHCSSYRTV